MKILLLLVSLAVFAEGRRVRVRPVSSADSLEDAPQQVEYYAEQEEDQGPVLVSRQDTYGRANGQPRLQPKLKSVSAKAPPVQTIRNYNKLNDDGSFTFGYEAADGSFKEETRGTDCVVRGKYGYIDPDGNKREFTYVSGNPCDPNAVQSEEEEEDVPSGEENVPQNIPQNFPLRRPQLVKSRPAPTSRPRPTQTVFQQDYNKDSEEDEEENVPVLPTHRPRPTTPSPVRNFPVPSFAQLEEQVQPQVLRATQRPKLIVTSQPRPSPQQVSITPRPTQPPATTYRPQLVRLSTVTPASAKKRPQPSLDLDEELKNFQLEHNVVSTPRPSQAHTPKALSGSPIYTSELVFDPSSGQYNTVLYQQLPQSQGEFNLRGRLQPYVHNPQPQPFFQPRPFSPRPGPPPSHPFHPPTQQQLFQQQQSALLQQSQQLFAAQQKKQQETKPQRFPASLLQQEPQRFTPGPSKQFHRPPPPPPPQQPFFFVAPSGDRTSLSNGQIDAFLRGHSLAL
ncbi:extensin-like [Cimex lectularius]|uniref:CPR type cuticle protein n=1 Tax=Cimex lectularius TaxID=79782 RepID=A0A8I6S4C4_CIMLE|nr:extensin-like [Cimex lectularius]